jgi:Cu+-exporting ATPase
MDHHHENKVLNNRLTDPVCGMAVTEASNFMKKLTIKLFTFAVKIAT